MDHIYPDMDWNMTRSKASSLPPRCPHANVNRCPRYYQSYALLGETGITTTLSEKTNEGLLDSWRKSDLWPSMMEHETSLSGSDGKSTHFSNFCPEVTFDIFGLFASSLSRYVDEIDRNAVEKWLVDHGRAFEKDWRWEWASLSPMHYSECPLYSQFSISQAGGSETMASTKDSFEIKRNVFVVHGRDSELRKGFFQFLRAANLNPIEWSEAVKLTGKASPYIGEILETAFNQAQAVVVLLSPDDEVRLSPTLCGDQEKSLEKNFHLQARPNVLFEAGMALATHPERALFVEIGDVKPFSDIAGRHTVRLTDQIKQRKEVLERLKNAGCDVSMTGHDWIEEGLFSIDRRPEAVDVKAHPEAEEPELEYRAFAYWNGDDGPFCQRCYDYEKVLGRLQGGQNDEWHCPGCKSSFRGPGYRIPVPVVKSSRGWT